jgi:hypothetical protein
MAKKQKFDFSEFEEPEEKKNSKFDFSEFDEDLKKKVETQPIPPVSGRGSGLASYQQQKQQQSTVDTVPQDSQSGATASGEVTDPAPTESDMYGKLDELFAPVSMASETTKVPASLQLPPEILELKAEGAKQRKIDLEKKSRAALSDIKYKTIEGTPVQPEEAGRNLINQLLATDEERDKKRELLMKKYGNEDAVSEAMRMADIEAVKAISEKERERLSAKVEGSEAAGKELANELELYGLKKLTDEDRAIASLVKKINAQYAAGVNRDNNAIAELSHQLSQLKENRKTLYDPATGKQVDSNSASQEAVQYEKDVAAKADELRTYKGRLDSLYTDKYLQLKTLEDLYLKGGVERNGIFRTYESLALEPSWMGGDVDQADRLKSLYLQAKKEFDGVNRAMLMNEDPSGLQREGFFSSAGEALVEALPFSGDVRTRQDLAEGFVKSLQEEGVAVTEAQQDRVKKTMAQNLGQAVGASIPEMVKIAVTTMATEGLGTLPRIKKAIDATRGMMKSEFGMAGSIASDLVGQTIKGAVSFGAVPGSTTSAAMGAGEGFAQGLVDAFGVEKMLRNSKYAKLLTFGAKVSAGTTAETIQEFAGDYLDNLKKSGYDYDKAYSETFGNTPDEMWEKVALVAMTSGMFSGAFNVGGLLRNAKTYVDENAPNTPDGEAVKSALTEFMVKQDKLESELKQKEQKTRPTIEKGEVTEVKTTTDDKKDITGVSGQVQVGKEPEPVEPIQEAGVEEIETSRILQAQEEVIEPTTEVVPPKAETEPAETAPITPKTQTNENLQKQVEPVQQVSGEKIQPITEAQPTVKAKAKTGKERVLSKSGVVAAPAAPSPLESFITESGVYRVQNTTHGIKVTNLVKGDEVKTGKPRVDAIREYQEAAIPALRTGRTAVEVNPNLGEAEYESAVADISENPAEVATTWKAVKERSKVADNSKDGIIAYALSGFPSENLTRYGDRKAIQGQQQIYAKYTEDGGVPIDTQAQEMSEDSGIEITPQDIIDFVMSNPNGKESYSPGAKELGALKDRFRELTGLELTAEYAEKLGQAEAQQEAGAEAGGTDEADESELSPDDFMDATVESEPDFFERMFRGLDEWEEGIIEHERTTMGINIPVVIAKVGIKALRVSLQAGQKLSVALKDAVKAMKATTWYKSLTDNEKARADVNMESALRKVMSESDAGRIVRAEKRGTEKTPGTAIKETKGIVDTSPKVTTTEAKGLKEKLKTEAKAASKAARFAKSTVAEALSESVSEMKGKLSAKQVTAISNAIEKTNFESERSIAELGAFIDRVVDNANYAQELSDAKGLIGKAKKLIRSKKIPFPIDNAMRNMVKIKPHKVLELGLYVETLNELVEQASGKAVGVGDAVSKNVERLSKQAAEYDSDIAEQVNQKLYEKSGLAESGVTRAEFDKMQADIANQTDDQLKEESESETDKKSRHRVMLETFLPVRLKELDSLLDNEEITEKQKAVIRAIQKVDLNDLSVGQLKELNNVLTGILDFGSFSLIGRVKSIVSGYNKSKGFTQNYKDTDFRAPIKGRLKDKLSVTNFFKSVVAGSIKSRKFMGELLGDLHKGNSRATTKSELAKKKMMKVFKGGRLKPSNNWRLGAVAFALQNQGGSGAEVQAEFEQRKARVLADAERMINHGWKDKEGGVINSQVGKAERKRINKRGEDIKKAYDSILKDAKAPDEVVTGLTGVEREAYELAKAEFDEIKPELKESFESFDNKQFVEYANYFPTEARRVGKVDAEFSEDSAKIPPSTNVIDAKQSGTTFARQPLSATGDMVYNYDFYDLFGRKYHDSVYSIETLEAREELKNVLNGKEIKKIIGSNVLTEMKSAIGLMVAGQKGELPSDVTELNLAEKAFYALIRQYKGVKLATIDQFFKQYVPIIVETSVINGVPATVKAHGIVLEALWNEDTRKQLKALMEGTDVANRVMLGEEVVSKQMRGEFDKLTESDLAYNARVVRDAVVRTSAFNLKHFDKQAAVVSWLSSYIKEVEKGGGKFNLAKESENRSSAAIDQANGKADDINNVSDIHKTAALFAKKDKGTKLMKELFWNYRSFSLNGGVNAILELRNLSSKGLDKAEKEASFRYLVGYMGQMLTYGAIKAFIIQGAWELAADALFGGIDKDDEDETKGRDVIVNAMAEPLLSTYPEYTGEAAKRLANGMNDGLEAMALAEESDRQLFYTGQDAKLPGAFAFSEEFVKSVPLLKLSQGESLSPSEKMKLGALMGVVIGSGDLERLMNKAAQRNLREEKWRESKRR